MTELENELAAKDKENTELKERIIAYHDKFYKWLLSSDESEAYKLKIITLFGGI
jgi:hypothetical protein